MCKKIAAADVTSYSFGLLALYLSFDLYQSLSCALLMSSLMFFI